MTKKVFIDLHHSDLYYSLIILFEYRFGWEVYRPIGFDWFYHGYWKIAEPYGNAMDTVGQYLDPGNQEWDQYKNLNGNNYLKDGIYYIYEPVHKYYQKAITLQQFKDMKFDIIMPTFQSHDYPYSSLQQQFQPQAKVVCQMGNTGQKTHIHHVMHSAPYNPKLGQNAIYYHQEIDHEIYKYVNPPIENKKIISVVNCLPYPNIYHIYKSLLSEVEMRSYGSDCPDGSLFGCRGVGEEMRKANIGWHLKPLGGLGHSFMGWGFSGRPTITNLSQARYWGGDTLALFEPGVTCHDIEAHTQDENCRLIRRMLEPEENIKWCERTLRRFNDIINYDEDEKKLRIFFERVFA